MIATSLHTRTYNLIVSRDVLEVHTDEASWAKTRQKMGEGVLVGPPARMTAKQIGPTRKFLHIFANLSPRIFVKC